MDWFTLFGVPFARPPQRVPFGGRGGTAGQEGVGEAREPDGAVKAEARSGKHGTFYVIPLFRHYFSQKASWRLERISFLSRLSGPAQLGRKHDTIGSFRFFEEDAFERNRRPLPCERSIESSRQRLLVVHLLNLEYTGGDD